MNGLCKLCKKNYKDQHGIYSNFLKHIKRAHPLEYDQIFNHGNECSTEEQNIISDDRVAIDSTSTKNKQNRIISSIAKNSIIGCNLPFNLVESPGFRDFMKECNVKYKPISSKKLKRDIVPSFKSTVLKVIGEQLNNIDYLTLTVDGWSDRRCRSFLGIICHFIDSKMIPHAVLIDFLRIKSPHTGENIRQLTEEVLDKFNIKEKVYKIVTDNASSMIKAYKFGLFVEEEVDAYGDDSNSTQDVNHVFDDHVQGYQIQILEIRSFF
ncbi:unnamed protein product [Rotaria socialis]|nr:unnamed protein product [Rotaria socialis]